jgi:hypothetical protein
MAELVTIWTLIMDVQLSDDEDTIRWKWTGHGQYTTRSAYKAQLAGSLCTFNCMAIWKSKTEGKHHFLAWLLAC